MTRGRDRLLWLALGLSALLLTRSPGGDSTSGASGETTRFLAFRMDESSGGLSFVLEPDEREIKLMSWLVAPHRPLADSRVTTPYAMSLELADAAGRPILQDRVWLRARGSLVSGAGGQVYRPNWLEHSDEDVSDDLLTRLDIDGPIGGARTLTLRPAFLPTGSRALFAVFSQRPRSAASALRVTLGDDPSLRERLAARFMPFGWDEVPQPWTANLLATRWLRLPALGEAPPTEEVLTTGEREPWDDAPALGVLVPPGGAVAYNLEGGPILSAVWYDDAHRPIRGDGVKAQLRVVHLDGTATVVTRSQGITLGPIQGDPTICSVQILLDPSETEPRYLVASTRADGGQLDRAWGDPPRRPVDDQGDQAVGPDLRDLILYRTDSASSTLVYPLEDPHEIGRLSFRIPLPLSALQGLLGAAVPPVYGPHVSVRARGADGTELATWTHDVSVIPSLFERYVQTPDEAAAVSEPDEVYVVPPPGTSTLEVSSSGPVDVGLRVRRPEPINRQYYRDYQLPEGAAVDARYVPWARDRWHARVPVDTDDLLAQGREIRVDAQVRLDRPRVEGAPRDQGWVPSELPTSTRRERPRTPHALPLPGPFQIVAEPASRGSRAGNRRSALGPTPVTLELPASGDLRVDYRVRPEGVGQTVTLEVGDRALTRRLDTAGGQLLLSGLEPGRAAVSLRGPAGIWLARAPGGDGWVTRRVIHLNPGQSVLVSVPGRGAALTVLPYLEAGVRPQGALRWSVGPEDLGVPGLYDSFGDLQGSVALSEATSRAPVHPMSWAAEALSPLSAARLWMADNLPAGAVLRLSLSQDAPPIWVRAIASWSAEAAPPPQHGRVRSER